jgi:hypothetical protein
LDFLQLQARTLIIIRAKEWEVEAFNPTLIHPLPKVIEEEERRKHLQFNSKMLNTGFSSV